MTGAQRVLFAPEEQGLARVSPSWFLSRDGDPQAVALYERHYSARRYQDGRVRSLFVGPGEKAVLLTGAGDALFAWRLFLDRRTSVLGLNCAVFRNEGACLSSALIREATAYARARWPEFTPYTYVDPRRVRSRNPGYCFLCAGWQRERDRTLSGKCVLVYKEG